MTTLEPTYLTLDQADSGYEARGDRHRFARRREVVPRLPNEHRKWYHRWGQVTRLSSERWGSLRLHRPGEHESGKR